MEGEQMEGEQMDEQLEYETEPWEEAMADRPVVEAEESDEPEHHEVVEEEEEEEPAEHDGKGDGKGDEEEEPREHELKGKGDSSWQQARNKSVARIQFVGSGQFGELSWLLVVTSLIEAFVLMGLSAAFLRGVRHDPGGRSSRMMGRNRTSAFQQTKPNSGSQLDLTNAPLQEVTISNGLRTLHLLWHLAKVPDVPKFDGETLLQSYLECRFLGLSNVEALTTLGGSSPLQLIQAAELWSEGDPEVEYSPKWLRERDAAKAKEQLDTDGKNP
eukprot:g24602.t1